MANNRELGQFGRLVTVIDNTFVGVGTTSGQTITFGNIAPVNVNASGVVTATSFVGDGSGLTNISGSGGGGTSSQWTTGATGITTTSNVGIGTTLPTANLHVVGSGTTVIIIDGGNAKIIGNLNVTGTVFATDFDAVPGGGSYQGVPGIVTSIVAGTNVTVSGSTGQVTINSTASGSSQWTTGASGITTTSNVGIKSTTPTSALDVTGDVKISGVATATSFIKSGGTSGQFLKADGSVDSTTYASQSYVDSKVGLSTSGLASQSYVDSKVGLSTVGLLASTGSGINLTGIVTSIVAGTNVTVSGSTGQVTINSTASGSQWTTGASGISTTSSVLIGSATPTGTASQPLQVTGGAYVSGSVGLGTTNPVSKLDVSGGSITLSSVPFFRNIPTISADYTVTTSYNEMSIGPITVNSGVTVTVNSGATWTVV